MTKRSVILFLIIALAVIPVTWAAVNVKTIPLPTPTTKLRLFVHLFTIVSSDLRHGAKWPTSHEDYLANQISFMEKFGIYEFGSESDVKATIGDQDISYGQMERNDWGLAREIGKGLHADYVMVITRKKQKGMQGVDFLFEAVMINTETGKNFRASYKLERLIGTDIKELAERNQQAYRTIFNLAKEDLLAVAVKKSRAFVPKSSAPPMQPEPATAAPSQRPGEGTKKVLVCDFDSNEQNRTVAMILAEALREELLTLKKFALVDQEDLQRVRKNVASQGTELIDEKQAVTMGKGVAADQVVTGRLALEGEAFVVQAKRTGVDTVAALGRASLTFRAGQEGEVMKRLPAFARELMGLKQ
jgi:hypothetical protein